MKGKLPCWRATERIGLSTVQRCAVPRCVLLGLGVVGQMYKLHVGTGVKGKAFMPHAQLRTTKHKRRLYWLYGPDQLLADQAICRLQSRPVSFFQLRILLHV